MLRLRADFNERLPDGACWILWLGDKPLAEVAESLGLYDGMTMILYENDGNFEVRATLKFIFIDDVVGSGWVACPDYATLIDLQLDRTESAMLNNDEAYHPCSCCGSRVIAEPGGYEICPVCNWEDDPVQSDDPDYAGGANVMSLSEAKRDWERHRCR